MFIIKDLSNIRTLYSIYYYYFSFLLLTLERRKVTVNDLSPADIQGFLYQRLRSKHNQNVHWEKRWFVLLGNCLYGFKSKDDPKAACLIFLSGFTVALASEVSDQIIICST